MSPTHRLIRGSLLVLTALSALGNGANAQSARENFHSGYYVEHAETDCAGASKLYNKVVRDPDAQKDLVVQAKSRLAACRERLASEDLSKLMPPNALAYLELNRPGAQVAKLLKQLGLLGDGTQAAKVGGRSLAISPILLKELLGLGGLGIAITGFDPQAGQPSGVAVLNPGNLEVVRGLLQTVLPAACTTVEPIAGFATFDVEGEVLITLTSHLVIAATDRKHVEDVIDRLQGRITLSLATNPVLEEAVAGHEDALLTFFVNAKLLLPMVKKIVTAEGGSGRELAMADALLDLDSLNSLTGQIAIHDDGVSLAVNLSLDGDHRNLVYNFLRTPPLDSRTFGCIPEGVAGFVAAALNHADSKYAAAPPPEGGTPIVTALDLGREVFANITSVALFALPTARSEDGGRPRIPEIGLALTVHDATKSEAIWTLILGIANLASGGEGMEGTPTKIAGVAVRRYQLPDGVTIFFATTRGNVLVATSEGVIKRAVRATRGKNDITTDSTFADAVAALAPGTTMAVFVHAGRVASIARGFMSKNELAEADPIFRILSDTVASLTVEHSTERFRIVASISGLPDVGDLVARELTKEAHRHERPGRRHEASGEDDGKSAVAERE